MCVCRSETTYGSWFSPTMWAPGIELRSSGLAASTFICWVLSLAQGTSSIFYLHIVYLLLTFSLTLAFGLRAGAQVQRPRRTSHWASRACSSHPYILIKVILVYLMLEGSCCLVVNYTFFFIIFCSKLLLVLRKTTTFYLFILNPVTFYWML